jgi:stearoyl-CoA desaturase (delta-9 desaturase)
MNLKMNNLRTTALYYAGALGACYAASTSWNVGWAFAAFAAFAVHVVVVSIFSAVVHRYFCHRAFDANPTLMWLLSFVPVAYGYATPAGWAPLHSAHHALADTDRDTHLKGWAGLFTANYRMPPMRYALAGKWFHGARHAFLHNNALGVVLLWHTLLWLISPQAFLWLGMVPLFTLHFCNGLHRVFSHKGVQAHNRWYLEYLCPMGGEWIHDEHHVNARKSTFANRWYELDTGAVFVRLLRTTA